MADQPVAVPLVEQLRSVPIDAKLRIDTPNALGCMDTRSIPVGRICHEAADAIARTSIGDTPAPQSTEGGEARQELPDPECLKREPVCQGCGYEPPDCTCGVKVLPPQQGENHGQRD